MKKYFLFFLLFLVVEGNAISSIIKLGPLARLEIDDKKFHYVYSTTLFEKDIHLIAHRKLKDLKGTFTSLLEIYDGKNLNEHLFKRCNLFKSIFSNKVYIKRQNNNFPLCVLEGDNHMNIMIFVKRKALVGDRGYYNYTFNFSFNNRRPAIKEIFNLFLNLKSKII